MITMDDFIPEKDPLLREVAEEVSFPLDAETQELADLMLEFLKNSQDEEIAEKYELRAGVGVAAPQIGVDKQIFAVFLQQYDEARDEMVPVIEEVFFNPKIISHSAGQVALKEGEGCLSVRRSVPGYVPRPQRVRFQYQDRQGQVHELKLRDYQAIVVQHEMDHLKGILFYDHINARQPWYQDPEVKLI